MARLTYCTNVHPLNSFSQWKDTISFFGPKIKDLLKLSRFPLGLWFNNEILEEINSSNSSNFEEIKEILEGNQLLPFTFNGFPYGNFHDKVIKTKVYSPNWATDQRSDYFKKNAVLLAKLLDPKDQVGTISTLPIGWKPDIGKDELSSAVKNLKDCIGFLKNLADKTGKMIRLCLEPEPGCYLESTSDVIRFWEEQLRKDATEKELMDQQNFLGLCYDTCHQAVQYEDSEIALNTLKKWNIPIGKMQLSNAIHFPADEKKLSYNKRKNFAEERYLHQTRIQEGQEIISYNDLPEVLDGPDSLWQYSWRSHFHLPLFAQRYLEDEKIQTTHKEMLKALTYSLENNLCEHYEVETYTWGVLPINIRPKDDFSLAQGIAREIESIRSFFPEM